MNKSNICHECELQIASQICSICDQNLCSDCDQKIHKKGKRSEHIREPFTDIKTQLLIFDSILNQKSQTYLKNLTNQDVDESIVLLLAHKQSEFLIDLKKNYKKGLFCNSIQIELSPDFHDNKLGFVLKKALLDLQQRQQIKLQKVKVISERPHVLLAAVQELAKSNFFEVSVQISIERQQDKQDFINDSTDFDFGNGAQIKMRNSRDDEDSNTTIESEQDTAQCAFINLIDDVSQKVFSPLKLKQNSNMLESLSTGASIQKLNCISPYNNAFDINEFFVHQDSFIQQIQIPLNQAYKSGEIPQLPKLSKFIQDYLRLQANKGNLMLNKSKFQHNIFTAISENFKDLSKADIFQILQYSEQIGLYHTTTRKFGDSAQHSFVSILLDSISVESIQWVLKSLKVDKMTPNEKLVLSRIKECFALKISQITWQGILKFLNEINQSDQKIQIQIDFLSDQSGNQNPTTILWLKDDKWTPEDTQTLDQQDELICNSFLNFIDQFFKEDQEYTCKRDKKKWSSSVENILTKNATKKNIFLPPKSISKAIPGGKYGCAQFIKCCGPEILQNCSLGKISLIVQESINRQFLVYHKTLLIKSSANNASRNLIHAPIQVPQATQKYSPDVQRRLIAVKSIIVQILIDYQGGLALARLPRLIQNKLNFQFDLHELGFMKLKELLQTIPDVVIENPGTTISAAKLVKKIPMFESQQFIDNISQSMQDILQKYGQLKIQQLHQNLIQDLNIKENFYILFDCENFFTYLQKFEEPNIQINYQQQDIIIKTKRKKCINFNAENFYPQKVDQPPGFTKLTHDGQTVDSLRHFQAIKRIFDNGIDDELTNQHDDKENFRFINSLLDDDDIILSKNKSNLILKENKWKNQDVDVSNEISTFNLQNFFQYDQKNSNNNMNQVSTDVE